MLYFFLLAGSGVEMLCLGQQPDYRDSTRWDIELPVWVPGFRGAVSFGDITLDTDGNGGGGGSGPGILDHFFDSKLGLDYYLVLKVFNAGVTATLPNPIPSLDFTTNWTEFLLGASIYYYWRNFTLQGPLAGVAIHF